MRHGAVFAGRAVLVLAVFGAVACAAPNANDPARYPDGAGTEPDPSGAAPGESIPPYFSVEIDEQGTLRVDGQVVPDVVMLAELARAAVSSGKVGGAAILTAAEFPAERRHEVARVLVDAGFVHVRLARAPLAEPAPPAEAASSPAPTLAPSAATEPVSASAPTAAVASPAVTATPKAAPNAPTGAQTSPSPVSLKSIGLHIGGATDEDQRAKFLRVLESSFDELRACYADLGGTHRSQSFGVDLYVPKSGAPPKVRDVRTRLGDEAFRTCVVGAFERLEFEPPPRGPMMLSYSVRFDPPTP